MVGFSYLPHNDTNKWPQIVAACKTAGVELKPIIYDRRNPTGAGEKLTESIRKSGRRLYLDISAMSRLLIVQAITAIGSRPVGFSQVSILYAEARDYPPCLKEVQEAKEADADGLSDSVTFISSGVFEVTIVPELSSVALQGQPVRLVVFPSFNTHQLWALRSEIQPARYSIINGVPPAAENKWRLEAIRERNHVQDLQRAEELSTSTLDYRETLNALLQVYSKYSASERILIAPTGSKMQAVATGIFRTYMDDVQIVYPTPRSFAPPERFTQGVRQLYHLPLDAFPVANPAEVASTTDND